MQAPRVEKITLNMGVGEAKLNTSLLDAAAEQLGVIAGQKPAVRRARKSIANFKLREGMPVGVKVTLRGERMWEMLDRLQSVAIPRIRDFRGLNPRSFDGRGNYSLGVREQIIFPEIDYDSIDQVRGLDVTITTTRRDRRGGLRAASDARHAVPERGAGPAAAEARQAQLEAAGEAAAEEQAAAAPEGRAANRRRRGRRAVIETAASRARGRIREKPQSDGSSAETEEEPMAKTSQIVRQQRGSKYQTRNYNRCRRCGRARAYYRKFGLCRICLREIAHEGMIPGMTKSSW